MMKKLDRLTKEESFLFWFIWLVMVVAMNLILLKFVIAEIKGVFARVKRNLNEVVLRERAALCAEADIMRPNYFKSKIKYPKYFVVREVS